jgi:hypothetical protein
MPTEQQAIDSLDQIARMLEQDALRSPAPSDHHLSSRRYRQIRGHLDVSLTLIERIPVYGRKTALVIRYLMQIADDNCGE